MQTVLIYNFIFKNFCGIYLHEHLKLKTLIQIYVEKKCRSNSINLSKTYHNILRFRLRLRQHFCHYIRKFVKYALMTQS